MKLPDVNRKNVQLQLNEVEIIEETIQQIMKDFGMFGMDIVFSGDIENAYFEIFNQVVYQIEDLFRISSSRLLAVLYQIDISNEQIEKAHNITPDSTLQEVVAEQIIQRELKKVLTRRYFKLNTNKELD
ncbi:MAG: hypothetical protein JEZ09_06745 [Salinivirgaceae bacterium]|nr:hypothetical protein [Salinivirgaceae bacterium]